MLGEQQRRNLRGLSQQWELWRFLVASIYIMRISFIITALCIMNSNKS